MRISTTWHISMGQQGNSCHCSRFPVAHSNPHYLSLPTNHRPSHSQVLLWCCPWRCTRQGTPSLSGDGKKIERLRANLVRCQVGIDFQVTAFLGLLWVSAVKVRYLRFLLGHCTSDCDTSCSLRSGRTLISRKCSVWTRAYCIGPRSAERKE